MPRSWGICPVRRGVGGGQGPRALGAGRGGRRGPRSGQGGWKAWPRPRCERQPCRVLPAFRRGQGPPCVCGSTSPASETPSAGRSSGSIVRHSLETPAGCCPTVWPRLRPRTVTAPRHPALVRLGWDNAGGGRGHQEPRAHSCRPHGSRRSVAVGGRARTAVGSPGREVMLLEHSSRPG